MRKTQFCDKKVHFDKKKVRFGVHTPARGITQPQSLGRACRALGDDAHQEIQ